jgi:hypothetical protein
MAHESSQQTTEPCPEVPSLFPSAASWQAWLSESLSEAWDDVDSLSNHAESIHCQDASTYGESVSFVVVRVCYACVIWLVRSIALDRDAWQLTRALALSTPGDMEDNLPEVDLVESYLSTTAEDSGALSTEVLFPALDRAADALRGFGEKVGVTLDQLAAGVKE